MSRTPEQIDALLDSLSFELPRRSILFTKDTELPDQSLLGYTGDPNNAVLGNTSGESLLYNCGAGTRFQDRGTSPYVTWEKVENIPGGIWMKNDSTVSSGTVLVAYLSGTAPVIKRQYLKFAGVPSNLIGWVPGHNVTIKTITVTAHADCSGWVRIRKNNQTTNLYSIVMSSQKSKQVTGLSIPLSSDDTIQVLIQSSNGMNRPLVAISSVTT